MEKIKRNLNLQLLAKPNTQTTTTTESGNDLSAEMKTYYDTELIEMAGPQLVHHQFGMQKPIPKGKGKKIEFRKFSNFEKATTPLTEGVTPDGSKMNVTIIEKEVAQYGDYVTISDVLELTAIDDFILEATNKHGQNAGLTLDTICRNEINSGTNVRYAPKLADGTETEVTKRIDMDATCVLTPDLVAKAVADLKGNNAPKIDGSYIAIIHPFVAYDLMKSKEWIDVAIYADKERIFEGEIGKLRGVRFVETTEAKIWNDTTCPNAKAASDPDSAKYYSVFSTLFIGKDAYANVDVNGGGLEVIVKQKGSAGSADPLNQRSTVGWKGIYAAKIRIPEYIVRVESVSAYSKTAEAN